MSFAKDAGYFPNTISQLMEIVRANVNEQFGTTYDTDTFLGTNFYKYFYALIQRLQENEIKTSEIFLRLQEYFVITNESIERPNTTHPGLVDYFLNAGYRASTKKPIDADAGKLYVCVDTDELAVDYAAVKLAICNLVKDCCVAGVVSQGSEVEAITLPNLQSFDFKFNLPNRQPILLRLTLTISDNNEFVIDSDAVVAQRLFDNINAKYRLGLDFEPQRYFSVVDGPWASEILLEYSTDAGSTYTSNVFAAVYDDLLTFDLGDIEVIEV